MPICSVLRFLEFYFFLLKSLSFLRIFNIVDTLEGVWSPPSNLLMTLYAAVKTEFQNNISHS